MYKAGDILDGYELLEECGSGAFGSVFLAVNHTLEQECALKVLYKLGKGYQKELEGLKIYKARCSHANLMHIDHVGENAECIFYTMDKADNLHPEQAYCPDTLGNRLKERMRLSPEEIFTMLQELLDGLEILHNAGILHRDIKPDNILWVEGHAMFGDIGLISLKPEASMAGTPGFIAPRVLSGKNYTRQDDLYALGKVIYCALTGLSPMDFPEIPDSVFGEKSAKLMQVYNAVLAENSAIHTVEDFKKILAAPLKPPRKNAKLFKICGSAAAFLLLVVLSLAVLSKKKDKPDIQPVPVQPAGVAKPRQAVIPKQEQKPQIQQSLPVAPKVTVTPAVSEKRPVTAASPKPVIVQPSAMTSKPKPATPVKQISTPAPKAKEAVLFPGNKVYELKIPFPSTRSQEYSPVFTGQAASRIEAKIQNILEQFPENKVLKGYAFYIKFLYEKAQFDFFYYRKDPYEKLTLLPLPEMSDKSYISFFGLPKAEALAEHEKKMQNTRTFLKRYPPVEQALIIYYARTAVERNARNSCLRQRYTNFKQMFLSASALYKEWVAAHEALVAERAKLTKLPLKKYFAGLPPFTENNPLYWLQKIQQTHDRYSISPKVEKKYQELYRISMAPQVTAEKASWYPEVVNEILSRPESDSEKIYLEQRYQETTDPKRRTQIRTWYLKQHSRREEIIQTTNHRILSQIPKTALMLYQRDKSFIRAAETQCTGYLNPPVSKLNDYSLAALKRNFENFEKKSKRLWENAKIIENTPIPQ